MQVKGISRTLLAGEPHCSPSPVVISEAVISTLRTLHRTSPWTETINNTIIQGLNHVGEMADLLSLNVDADKNVLFKEEIGSVDNMSGVVVDEKDKVDFTGIDRGVDTREGDNVVASGMNEVLTDESKI